MRLRDLAVGDGGGCIPSTASIRAYGFCDKMEQGVPEPEEECLARFRPMQPI